MNQLITTNNNNEVRMTSKELCELINAFRKEEGNETVKEHKNLLRDIDNEVKVLENVGIPTKLNFEPTTYTDGTRNYRCYSLTEEAVLQMLNKESAVVRYKTQQYIKALKEQLMANALPIPQNNIPQLSYNPYNNYNFKQYLNEKVKIKDIPDEIENFIQAHESDTPDKRLSAYKVAKNALDEIKTFLTESWQFLMIQSTIDKLNKLIELQKTYINRTRLANQTKQIKKLQDQIQYFELDSFENYQRIEKHSFTVNCSYAAKDDHIVCSDSYKQWKKNMAQELEALQTLESLNVNPEKPMKISIYFYVKDESFDVDNQLKSFIDALKNHYNFDDKMIVDIRARKFLTYAESFENGCIYFALKNLDQIEIDSLSN